MSAYSACRNQLSPGYNDVTARRESEIESIKEKLKKNDIVDIPLCRLQRVDAQQSTVRFGLKRGRLVYVFKYHHDVERDKNRNVINRARFVKEQLELAGYHLLPWDFKKGKPPKFWEEGTMEHEEEDDDLYGPAEIAPNAKKELGNDEGDDSGDEPMDEESAEEDETDSDDSDEIDIIIERPAEVAPKPPPQQQPTESKAIKIEAPPPSTSTPSQAPKTITPQPPSQSGAAYPAVRTSTITVDNDPIYDPLNKTITQVDIDADLAEQAKTWRLPGADQSDYFNYGFDEFTWEMYRQHQISMRSNLAQQKAETAQLMTAFGPAPTGVPNAPSGPAAGAGAGAGGPVGNGAHNMGAMPPMMGGMNEEMMQHMMQQMISQGMDPSSMDFNSFMQMAGSGMPGFDQPGSFGAGGGAAGNQNRGGAGGRRGGRGRAW